MRKPRCEITVAVDDPKWRKPGLLHRIDEAARLALASWKSTGAITVLLTKDANLRALNAQFRGKNKQTNVLSFPADTPGYLGDIAIAYGVAAAEAKREKKRLIDHAAHLTIHGTLHLLGYDHETAREAKVMEALETELLAQLDIADPYERAKAAKR